MREEIVLILFKLILCSTSNEVKVQVKQGTLIGTTRITVFDKKVHYVFYGVPYAEAPIKKLRFKEPVTPKKWKFPYDATVDYHGACAQPHIIHKHGLYGMEDCLYLNIYTPTLSRNIDSKLPIIIWIHGYAFTSSFSHIHGGDFFVENNVIFITLTHRLSAFGFLGVRKNDVNMGIKDIVLALKWVRKNIKHFGGDKNKVTVMGNGSSATFLSLLLTTESNNLFSKLILQSGTLFDASTFSVDMKYEKNKFLKNLKKQGISRWKSASTRDIIAASQNIYSNQEIINSQRPLIPFLPVVENKSSNLLLTRTPREFFKNIGYINKTILIGFNTQESISEIIPFLHDSQYLKKFEDPFKYMVPFSDGCKFNITSKEYKTVASLIKSKYFQTGVNQENLLRYTSDLRIYPIIRFITTLLKVKGINLFVYKFNYNGDFNAFKTTSTAGSSAKVKGASQGDEICYLMKCEPLLDTYMKVSGENSNTDKIFIKKIVNIWANFAKSGKPSLSINKVNITCPQFTSLEDKILLLDKEIKLINPKLEAKIFDFWNQVYKKYFSPEHCTNKIHDEL